MSSVYGQFCPIALASEVLTQKWMLLIIREMNAGSTRFGDIKRGVPRISATLLKQRLDQLESSDVLTRKLNDQIGIEEYFLTDAGRELKQVLASIGEWGQRWARQIDPDDLDAGWLVWVMHRRIDTKAMPKKRTVIQIEFVDASKDQRLFWLVCEPGQVEVCLKPTGYDVDLFVETKVKTLAEVWRGIRPINDEIAAGRIALNGASVLRRGFPNWLLLSAFADIKK